MIGCPWWKVSVAAAVASAGLVAPPMIGIGAQEAACGSPYEPVATFSSAPERQYVEELGAPEVSVQATGPTQQLRGGLLEAAPGATEVVVTRPSGQLRLRVGTDEVEGFSAGDLDDDGIDEIWVGTPTVGFVVPGTTPDGSHEASVVGITTLPGQPALGLEGLFGDDAFAVSRYGAALDEHTTVAVVASDLMLAGPGGDASALPVTGVAPGFAVARLGFQDPQYLFGRYLVEFGGQARIYALAADGTETAQFIGEVLLVPSIAVEGPGGRYFAIRNQDPFQILNVFSLDAPCTPLQVLGTSPLEPASSTAPPDAPTPSVAGASLRFAG